MGRYSPWRHLRSLPHVDLTWTDDEGLLDGAEGRYFHSVQRILMDRRLGLQVERRCVLAHELGHYRMGHLPCHEEKADERQEAAVEQWAARQLIPLDALADALRWSTDPDEVAEECWVTRDLLEVRIAHLHPSERAWLRREVAD